IPNGNGANSSLATAVGAVLPASTTPAPGFVAETPASLGCVYFLASTRVAGCNPTTASLNPSGGSRVIAIVDAFDDPHAATDLAIFSSQFGLPAANFTKVFAGGVKPPQDPTGGWELEASLDIEWAHAMAPSARIILVEAASNSLSNLLAAETVAANLVAAAGGGEVSNSWGGGEFSSEASLDNRFVKSGVVFFASTGDSPGTEWPGVSPNVVAAGGTTISRNPATLAFIAERPGPKRGVAEAFLRRFRLTRLRLPASSEARVVCPTCRSMLILKQALGSLTARRSEARPAAVAELEDGGSWAERAFRHRLWRVSSTRLAISQPPATASSQRFIAILQILRTSKISQLITAVRSPGCRAKRVGISARALAVFKARLESKKVARIPGHDPDVRAI